METFYNRSILEAIECHELFGEYDAARSLYEKYDREAGGSKNERIKNQETKRRIVRSDADIGLLKLITQSLCLF
ncbi:MAG: hypothetical protein HOE90_00645 [Bacteriovoracaceae bacterium]|jgi:hypothetical protein|nr:hypothetical protein [Bacteriovoracaceae bacterium]